MESVDFEKEEVKGAKDTGAIIHSKNIRAGSRTYFFDVRSTRNNQYYLTITESKKRYDETGNFHYQKHKIFLYPEDFEKFSEALTEIVGFIVDNQPGEDI